MLFVRRVLGGSKTVAQVIEHRLQESGHGFFGHETTAVEFGHIDGKATFGFLLFGPGDNCIVISRFSGGRYHDNAVGVV